MANIKTSDVSFRAASGTQATGFLARSEPEGVRPGLIVLQEFWGLNDHIKEVTGRLAAEGFVALAPDMYDGKVTTDPAEARQLLTALDQAAALQKLHGAVQYLKGDPGVASDKIGVIGFCMGGFLALNLACHNRDVRAVTPFYGRIPPDSVLENLNAPILYFFGEQDHHLPAADVDRLEQFIERTGRTGGVVRYREADHAFFNDTRKEVYREADAKDAWVKALAFLRKHLEV
jgi:carboxymethylenebutenolidase